MKKKGMKTYEEDTKRHNNPDLLREPDSDEKVKGNEKNK